MKFPTFQNQPYIAYDTETTGLIYKQDKVFGFSLSLPTGEDFYFDIRQTPEAIEWINWEFENYNGVVVCHNASFDHRMSTHTGINTPLHIMDDTQIRATCIDETLDTMYPWSRSRGGYSLDALGEKYLGERKRNDIYAELAEMFGGKATRRVQMPNLQLAPSSLVAPYAKQDTRLTLNLWEWQEKEIERQGIQQIVAFEKKFMPVVIGNEAEGVRVDIPYAERAVTQMDKVVSDSEKALYKAAGREFNSNSSKQVAEVFECKQHGAGWITNCGTILKCTPKGAPQLGSDALRAMKNPIAMQILNLRSDKKTRDTFLKGHVIKRNIDGRVYPRINQMKGEDGGTGTGRLSYCEPALQQIPNRNAKVASIVKSAFLPEEGQVWLETDMASFEVRVFAHLVAHFNTAISDMYAKDANLDFHQWTGDLMGIPRNASYVGEVNAKQLNLSILFNSGKGAIAEALGQPFTWEEFTTKKGEIVRYKKAGSETIELLDLYHDKMKGVHEFAASAQQVATDRGYVRTGHGRRIHFPRGHKAYSASAKLVQSTAADENKENWFRVIEALGDDGRLMLNTHDSYSMSVNEDWKPILKRVTEAVERKTLRVPLLLDFDGCGKNWADAKPKLTNHN